MGQGGNICKDALWEAGDVIAMERPAKNTGSFDAHCFRVGSNYCDQLGCPQLIGVGGRAGLQHNCHCFKFTIRSERLMNLPLLLLQPVP